MKIKNNFIWSLNFEFSLYLGASFLGIGIATATKIMLIAKAQKISRRDALNLYNAHLEKFEKVFGDVDLAGWVSRKELKRIHIALSTMKGDEYENQKKFKNLHS